MTVIARDLPGVRLRRWAVHGVVGAAAVAAIWGAVSRIQRHAGAAGALAAAEASLHEHRLAADALAPECGIGTFSEESALAKFPMPIPPVPTKRETSCLKRVGEARANLIQDYEAVRKGRGAVEAARGAAKRWTWIAGILTAAFVAGVVIAEVRPALRRPARWKAA